MNCILPVVLYLLFLSYKYSLQKKLFFFIFAVSFPVFIISIHSIQLMRSEGFSTGSLSQLTSVSLLKDLSTIDIQHDLYRDLSLLIELSTKAIGGVRELMATTSANINDAYAPIAIFISGELPDVEYIEKLMLSVYNYLPNVNDGAAAGDGYGLWGGFILSGSYIVLFIGSFCACMIVCFVEHLFLKKNLYLVAIFFSIYLSLRIWRSFYFFILSRDLIMIGIFYYITAVTMNKLKANFALTSQT